MTVYTSNKGIIPAGCQLILEHQKFWPASDVANPTGDVQALLLKRNLCYRYGSYIKI